MILLDSMTETTVTTLESTSKNKLILWANLGQCFSGRSHLGGRLFVDSMLRFCVWISLLSGCCLGVVGIDLLGSEELISCTLMSPLASTSTSIVPGEQVERVNNECVDRD